MRLAVLRFAGSRGDDEALARCREVLGGGGAEVRELADDDKGSRSLRGCDAALLACDFGGEATLSGAAVASPLMIAVVSFAARGGPVLGFGDGFRLLVEGGLLDGALGPAGSLPAGGAGSDEVHVVVEGRPTPWTATIPAGRILRMAQPRTAGRYLHDRPDLLEREGRIVLRYVDANGGHGHGLAQAAAIAGVANAAGNVVGLSPRPERICGPAADDSCGHGDGRALLDALRLHLAGRGGRVLARG